MKYLALLFAAFLIFSNATQALACGAGGHGKDGEDMEHVEE